MATGIIRVRIPITVTATTQATRTDTGLIGEARCDGIGGAGTNSPVPATGLSLCCSAEAVVGLVALTASASAAVVCNDDGDCWRSKDTLDYPPEARLHVYGDDYAIGPKYRWREAHEGHGYYRGGVWIGF